MPTLNISPDHQAALNQATEAMEVVRGLLRHLADLAEDTEGGVTLTGDASCSAMNVVYAAMRTLEAGQAAAERVFGTSAQEVAV